MTKTSLAEDLYMNVERVDCGNGIFKDGNLSRVQHWVGVAEREGRGRIYSVGWKIPSCGGGWGPRGCM